jgi:hypothetical protein
LFNRDEYNQLREELKKQRGAEKVFVGDKAKEMDEAKAFHEMLTPLQQQRQKYLQRKKSSKTSRQMDTLTKLQAFQATLSQAKKQNVSEKELDKATQEAYHGQVWSAGSSDEGKEADNEGDRSWMTAKLKFKKHIDVSLLLLGSIHFAYSIFVSY